MLRVGLVFSGGGGKGAYQIGVWKALEELGLSKHVRGISATSIGAVNSMLFINKDLEAAIDFWKKVRRIDIAPIKLKDIFNMILRCSLSTKDSLKRLLENNIDFKPLDDDIEVIVGCTEITWGYPRKKFFKLNYMEKSSAIEVILASCTIPFLFRPHRLSVSRYALYLDGGIMCRTPVEGLDCANYDKIIVVHLDRLNKINPLKYSNKKYINIYPSIYQGGIYQGTYGFTYNLAMKRIEAGYADTIKILKPMIGEQLSILP